MSLADALRKLRDKWTDRASDSERTAPPVLAHYTTGTALHGILATGELWGSNYAFVNDRMEFRFGQDVFRSCLTAASEKSDRDGRALIAETDQLFREQLSELYLFCFCETSDLLSQWRGYAQGAARYCLEIRWQRLKRLAKHIIGPVPVYYDQDMQRRLAQQLIDDHLDAVAPHTLYNEPDQAARAADCLYGCALPILARFKNPVFQEEREWRTVLIHEHDRDLHDLRFVCTDGVMKPFRPMLSNVRDHIDAVIVADSSRVEQAEQSARLMLARYGCKRVDVRRSVVPLMT